jgi:peptidyl-Lys metalloendopeptidase
MIVFFALLFVSNAWDVSIEPSTEETVLVTIVNTFQTPVTLCSWGSPLEDSSTVFKADLFNIVSTNGQKPMYIGILAKKSPTLGDFVTLQVGQSITAQLDLTKGYSFSSTGDYTVALSTSVRVFFGDLNLKDLDSDFLSIFEYVEMTSNSIKVEITSVNSPVWPKLATPLFPGLVGGPSPDSTCTSSEANTIRTAGSNAVDATAQGVRYVSGSCSSSLSYYIEWFGVCDSSRFSTVRTNLNRTWSGLSSGSYPVNCKGSECTANTYAYVYPSWANHTVFVCGYFWRVPTRNCVLDSQPGTLIHEMSHFNNVAGTRDVTYGISNCRTLARNNPAQAITNADNYCFYTDSCP